MKFFLVLAVLLAVVPALAISPSSHRLRATAKNAATGKLSLKTEQGSLLTLTQLPSPTFLSEDATCQNPNSGNSVNVITKATSVQEGICSYSGSARLLGAIVEFDSTFEGEYKHKSFCKNCYGGFVVGNAKKFVVVEYGNDKITIYKGKVSQRHVTANRGSPLSSLAAKSRPVSWKLAIDDTGSATMSFVFADKSKASTEPFMVPSSLGYIGFFSLQGVTQQVTNIKIKQGPKVVKPKYAIGAIPLGPDALSSSTEYDPNHTRHGSYLDNARYFPCRGWCAQSWCAKVNDVNQWIQVDLSEVRQVTQIKVQGRGDTDQWVTSVRIGHSNDGKTFTWLPQSFTANRDRNTIVTIPVNFRARYVRINPQSFHSHISLRFGVYGETDLIALKPTSQSSSTTWQNNFPVCGATNSLLHAINRAGASSWCSSNLDQNQWLQSDLGAVKSVKHILTQGRADADQWVTSFRVSFSNDGRAWSNLPGQFAANNDRYTVKDTPVNFKARYVRLMPVTWHNHISMRVAFRGTDL